MKTVLGLSVALAVAQVAQAADIEAGKEMAAAVCAACHGANGVSVSETTIPNLAAQPGAVAGTKSALLPNFATTRVTFPEGYKDSFTKYLTINFPATKQVRYYYANSAALAAAKAGKPLPDGSVLFAEVYAAKLDADKTPVTGADGFHVADKLLNYTAMAREEGWGKDIPEKLRNEEWNYAVFTADKQHRPGVNQAECLACHKPLDKVSYTFTLKELAGAK
jgi:hypothetical protein